MPNFQNRERWWEYIAGSTGSNEPFKTDTRQEDEDEDVASSREGSATDEGEISKEGSSEISANQPVLDQAAESGNVLADTTPEPNVAGSKGAPHEPTLRIIKKLPMVSNPSCTGPYSST